MKLSTDDLITMQCALASAIDTIKERLKPEHFSSSSLRHLRELKERVDAELLAWKQENFNLIKAMGY